MKLKIINIEISIGIDTIRNRAKECYGEQITYTFGKKLFECININQNSNLIQNSIENLMYVQFFTDFINKKNSNVDLNNDIILKNSYYTGNLPN